MVILSRHYLLWILVTSLRGNQDNLLTLETIILMIWVVRRVACLSVCVIMVCVVGGGSGWYGGVVVCGGSGWYCVVGGSVLNIVVWSCVMWLR